MRKFKRRKTFLGDSFWGWIVMIIAINISIEIHQYFLNEEPSFWITLIYVLLIDVIIKTPIVKTFFPYIGVEVFTGKIRYNMTDEMLIEYIIEYINSDEYREGK